jgi:hypothetical protein
MAARALCSVRFEAELAQREIRPRRQIIELTRHGSLDALLRRVTVDLQSQQRPGEQLLRRVPTRPLTRRLGQFETWINHDRGGGIAQGARRFNEFGCSLPAFALATCHANAG